MENKPQGNQPQQVWQSQETELIKMPADELRRRAREQQMRARAEARVSLGLCIALCVLFAWACVRGHDSIERAGWAVLSGWCIFFGYKVYKWIWPRSPAPDAGLRTTIEAYRSELERRRDYAAHLGWRSGVTFCFLGLALVLGPPLARLVRTPRLLLNAAPFFVLLAVWLAMFFPRRKRKLQELQREIDELGEAGRSA